MNTNLRFETYGPISFSPGIPSHLSKYVLPEAVALHAKGPWGLVCLQEIKTDSFILRHFIFLLHQTLRIRSKERNEGLQTLLSLKGELTYSLNEQNTITLKEKEYTLLNAGEEDTVFTVPAGQLCSLFNAYYHPRTYRSLLAYFPAFKKEVQRSLTKPHPFLYPSKVARYSVHDSIGAIWLDRYVSLLEQKHIELRLKTTLLTLLAQTYTTNRNEAIAPIEREKAIAARDIIIRDIRVRLPNQVIAAELNCSAGFLKRAFSKVYGIGLYHYLRKTRMEIAREMLLRGASLKAVALEVGMRPKNFPKEFKTFYGYTVTQLKKGLI